MSQRPTRGVVGRPRPLESESQLPMSAHVPARSATVLVADDEADMRLLIRLLLESAALQVEIEVVGEAADGAEVLRIFNTTDKQRLPDVVILDNRMPGLTGIEVAQRILANVEQQRIVLFSGHLMPEVIREARRIGITRCVGKECIEDLAHIVLDVLHDHE